jgi:hypothetical protein
MFAIFPPLVEAAASPKVKAVFRGRGGRQPYRNLSYHEAARKRARALLARAYRIRDGLTTWTAHQF